MRQGRICSINVGTPRSLNWHGRAVTTAIYKHPLIGPVAVHGLNVEGDAQADLSVHGGADKAVYAYALEDLDWWSRELEHRCDPGTFGENLTVDGMAVTAAVIGERWRIGDLVLEVAQPRQPCFKLGIRMEDPGFVRRFAKAGRPGAYLRIISAGTVEAGDPVIVEWRPGHGVTIADVSRALLGGAGARDVLSAPELPERVRSRLLERQR